jgi:hypothetical protein
MRMSEAFDQLPALYGDGIFPQLSTIVARYSNAVNEERTINTRMSSVRESIEHLFALHESTFALFSAHNRLHLLFGGVEVSRLMFNSFFLLNCCTCMNESPNDFAIRPPTLAEYLPLHEVLRPFPIVEDDLLGEVYNYRV